MRSLQKTNHEPCTCKGRKSVSVGSVCVSYEPWLELLQPIVCCYCYVAASTKSFSHAVAHDRLVSLTKARQQTNTPNTHTLSPLTGAWFMV